MLNGQQPMKVNLVQDEDGGSQDINATPNHDKEDHQQVGSRFDVLEVANVRILRARNKILNSSSFFITHFDP